MGGKRFDEEPKLNKKKVFSVFLGIVVIIMFCLTLSKLLQDGTEITNKQNEEVDKYFAVYTNNKWGVINQKGKYIINPTYTEMIVVPDEGTALFACVDEVDYTAETYKTSIINQNGEKAIGKPIGNYITIDVKKLKVATDEDIQKTAETLTSELKKIIDIHTDKQGEILVIGLGNIYVTPDALGPKVINEIDVTRHIKKYLPQYLDEGTRIVSAISPGVLGTTGIETVEILKGIVDNIKPKLLIAVLL